MRVTLRRSRWALAVALAVAALSACSAAPSPEDIPITRLASGDSALEVFGTSQTQDLVIRDNNLWFAVWNTIYPNPSSRPPLPVIDFTQEMVVGRAMGTKPTTGFDVRVLKASRANNKITVEVREISPGASCIVLPVTTAPVDFARMKALPNPVEFEILTQTTSCGTQSR